MSANAQWQEAISENLAAASIPGFKKQDLSFEAVQSGMMSQANPDPQVQFVMPHFSASTNFTPGSLRPTGVSTDVAIEGKGFFSVQMPDGATGYTRDGEFHLNSSGQLTNKQGYPILGDSGPIQIDPNLGGSITISNTGEISQGAEIRGKLKVVDFSQPEKLTAASGGIFMTNNNTAQPSDVPAVSLRQGFLEGSNTTPTTEMASLINVMRGFESNQRLMQIHSDRMSKAITELGNPT